MRKFLLCVAMTLLLLPLVSYSQSRQITGTVTDDKGNRMPLVSVLEKGTNNGTTTNDNGDFSLTVRSANATLVFTYTGMQSQELRVGTANTYNVSLTASGQLSEVVVTALGIRRDRKALGYSTQEIKTEELTQTRQPNIVNALQGRATGLQINSSGGAPGQDARIVMRGITSLDPNRPFQPLFIVDGIPIDNATDNGPSSSSGGLRGMTNRAADLNPDDIESINVLKGGAATALYGSRASNGAIIITTKSGRAGRVRASVTSTYGIENVNKTPEVQKMFTQGFSNVYDKASFWPSWGPTVAEAKAIDPTHPDELYNNFERGYQQGSFIRNTVNLSGGSEKATFSTSLSQYDHKGILPGSDYKNYSAKVGGEIKFSEKFRMGASFNFINSGGYRVNADRYNEQLAYWAPRWDVMDYVKEDGTMKYYGLENDNPVFIAKNRRFEDDVNRLLGNLNFTYSPTSWLDFSYRVGGDIISDARTETAPGPTSQAGEFYPADFRNYDKAKGLGGFIEEYRNNRRIINSTASINIKKDISDRISSSLRIGHDLYDTRAKYVYTVGDTLSDPTFFNLNNTRRVTGANNRSDYRIIGLFADLTLGLNDYVFLNLTGRNDWTSTLPENNRSYFFPSASISYVISQHLKMPDWVSFAKLRSSYAVIGKDAPPYSFSTGFIPPLSSFPGSLTLSDLSGDPNLKPEFTQSFEGGIELRALKNRVGLELTYYNNTSKDLIIPVSVTSSSGLSSVYLNAGSIRNKGIELSLSGSPIQQKDFSWDVRINYTSNDNKVLEIYPGLTEVPIASQNGYLSSTVTQKFIPGMPVGALFGRSYARYYGNDKEDATFIDYSRPLLIGANGFPVINTKQMYLGKTQPDWISSVYNDFRYKQFGLSFLFDAQQGLQKYNQMANWMSAFGIAPYTTDRRDTKVFEGVTANGAPNTKPVWMGQGRGPDGVDYGVGYYRLVHRGVSENFVEDASFIKLRNVTLSYQLPSKALAFTKFVSGASVAVTGNNLWISTDYTGFDPESSSFGSGSSADGFAGFTYPGTRSFMVSLNLSF
jgi:TonB-linked SusC/RagA family outer membrane protein